MDSIDREEIQRQLARIVESRAFRRARRLAELLVYITEETLAGRGDALQQTSIAQAVYERDENFSAASDSLVRVEVSRLRKALDRYYSDSSRDDSWRITLPLRTYTPVFEIQQSIPETDYLPGPGDRDPEAWQLPKIQVLPFNVHALGSQAIPLMLEESLTTDLSQFPSLRVLAFAGGNDRAAAASERLALARERQLDFAITGNVWQSGEQLRIEIALLDVAVGDQLWSGRFDSTRESVDLFDFPVIVSRKAAARIADAYGAVMQRMSSHFRDTAPRWAATFKAALRFFEMHLMPGVERVDACFNALEVARPLAESSAEYFGMLGFCQADRAVFTDNLTPDALKEAKCNVRQAVALDSTSTISQFARAYLAMLEREPDSLIDACERMVRSLPNSGFVQGSAGLFIAATGDYARALEHYRLSMELVPRYPGWFHLTPCFDHYHRGEYQNALREVNRIDILDFYWEQLLRASLLAYLGRKAEAEFPGKELLAAVPDFRERADAIIGIYTIDPPLANKIRRGLELAGIL